jgi:sortase A
MFLRPHHQHQQRHFQAGHPKPDSAYKKAVLMTASVIVGTGLGGSFIYHSNPKPEPVVSVTTPIILKIPTLNITTSVEEVGLDSNGNMGTPENIFAVGWYSLGVRPGETGNAVIDGHFNTQNQTPGIFYRLYSMRPGDEIEVTDREGQRIEFRVYQVTNESTVDFPVYKYFGPGATPKLHLITCEGNYDPLIETFNYRTVVSADLVAISDNR